MSESEKELIKTKTGKTIKKILWNLREACKIKSPIMNLERGQIALHKRIEQLNKKIINSL